MKTNDSKFRRFGLVGRNIAYSFSPAYFQDKFKKEQIQASYKIFDIKSIEQFPSIFLTKDLAGLNITTPYKEEALIFMDRLSAEAQEIGAINTVKFKGESLIGYNTDYIGFMQSLEPLLKPHHTQALILGSGGASKAVQYALKLLKISFKIVSRNHSDADYTYEALTEEILGSYPIIINTTPLGTHPDISEVPNLPFEGINSNHLVYDLIYNPEKTVLLNKAEAQGATIKNGEEMLKLQAEESWKVWNS